MKCCKGLKFVKENFNKCKDFIESNINEVETKIDCIKTSIEVQTETELRQCAAIIKSLKPNDVKHDSGFVLYNELKRTNTDKKISYNNGKVIIDYNGIEMILTVYKKDDIFILNMKFGNDTANFKYDFNKVIDCITKDKSIKEMGEQIVEQQEEQSEKVEQNANDSKNESSQTAANFASNNESIFEDGSSLDPEKIIDTLDANIQEEIKKEVNQKVKQKENKRNKVKQEEVKQKEIKKEENKQEVKQEEIKYDEVKQENVQEESNQESESKDDKQINTHDNEENVFEEHNKTKKKKSTRKK